MRYTLVMIVVSIGIIEFFQLVSILIFLYTDIFVVYVCFPLVSSIVIGTHSISYTYTCLFVLIIFLYLEHKSCLC